MSSVVVNYTICMSLVFFRMDKKQRLTFVFEVVDPLDCFEGSCENIGDSSAEGEHAAVVDDVVSGLLVVAEFASCCMYD